MPHVECMPENVYRRQKYGLDWFEVHCSLQILTVCSKNKMITTVLVSTAYIEAALSLFEHTQQ